MKQLAGKNRTAWIDYIKALAIILVIVDHSLDTAGKTSLGYYYIIRMAVPIFVLLSGYNFSAAIEKMGSVIDWYRWKRIKRKMISYLCPMLAVFVLWMFYNALRGRFTISGAVRAFFLQDFGAGSYYFLVIVQFYLIFPILYYLIRKWRKGGYWIIFCLSFLYEIILYFFPVSGMIYRVSGFRYLMLLALGIWIYDKVTGSSKAAPNTIVLLILSFAVGCVYIYAVNQGYREMFRYPDWASTNFLCSFYIMPLLYAVIILIQKRHIKIGWIHNTISLIGQSSYYILCTQMIMFWGIKRIWNWLSVPVSISTICNIILATGSGVCIYLAVENWKYERRYHGV